MSWTTERFLNEMDVSMKPDCWTRLGLESPARKFISENAMAAFELRDQVRSCKAWRVKSVEQIDDDFMMTVVIPLVLDNPMIASDGALLSWNDGYKDRRGPKRPSSQTEGEIALSYLQKRVLELSYQIEKMEALDVADGRGCGLITELRDIQGKYKTIALDVSRELFFKEVERCGLVYRVSAAMQELTEAGIPCSKMDVESFWLKLLAVCWGVEPCSVYSAARKVKSFSNGRWKFPM